MRTWARANLLVDFCDGCSGLFLDRGELFDLFRSEGYNCPPEALFRHEFSPTSGESLRCPKCEKDTLMPGTVERSDMWHCRPCNGFLVYRELLLGEERRHGTFLSTSRDSSACTSNPLEIRMRGLQTLARELFNGWSSGARGSGDEGPIQPF
ncbi:MAG: zf-TFIIB domain-containing protein [Gemmatimonadetes bacterium]|nr:zf-TFIIB domain-containing protein [Gemmatimonadota bacterium]